MEANRRSTVAGNVRAEMARRRVRQADLCAVLDMGRTSLHRRLSGEVAFDVDELDALALLFGVDVAQLVTTPEAAAMTGT